MEAKLQKESATKYYSYFVHRQTDGQTERQADSSITLKNICFAEL